MVENIPEGYKKTEVGIIPKDWECVELGDVVEYVKGYAFRSKYYRKNGVRIIRVSDTTFNSIKDDAAIYIDPRYAYEYDNWKLLEDDIIVSTVGSKPPMYDSLVGKSILINKDYAGSLLNQNAVVLRSKSKNQKLIYANLRQLNYIKHIEMIFRGNANQASITLNELFKFNFAIPKALDEQQNIANALSDIDELISSITKLIEKKKNIKQGAIQALLTGKKRLDGFSGTLIEKEIDDIFNITAGGDLCIESFSRFKTHNNIYKVFSNAITYNGFYGYTTNYKYEGDTITVTARGNIGYANYRNEKYDAIGRLLVLKPKIQVNCYFITEYINDRIDFIVESTGIPQLTAPQISKYIIKIPDYEEQTAISQILSDMDTEIEKLNQKLNKYNDIKQGMMQELLTGKRRLI